MLRRVGARRVLADLEEVFGRPVIARDERRAKGFFGAVYVLKGGRVEILCSKSSCSIYVYRGHARYRCTENGCLPLGQTDGLLGDAEQEELKRLAGRLKKLLEKD